MTLPTAWLAADVAAGTADVTEESGGTVVVVVGPVDVAELVDIAELAGVAELAAGALDAEPEPVAVEMVAWPAETACPTSVDRSDDRFAATELLLVAAPPVGPFWAVVAPGLVAADADLAVRRDNPMTTPTAAMATPAAPRQNRRTLVTSPLVTTVTLIRSG